MQNRKRRGSKGRNRTGKVLKRWMHANLKLIYGVVICVFLVLVGRLVYLSAADKYQKSALAQQNYVSSVIPYKRGNIVDRNGQILATSDLIYHLILDPKVLLQKEENVEPTIKALVEVYGLNETELRTI